MKICKCEHCQYNRRTCSKGERIDVWCEYPIPYEKWKLSKAIGYIGAEKKGVFPIKKTPKWCPLEVKE